MSPQCCWRQQSDQASHLVVKFGLGTIEGEEVTQDQISKMLDPRILSVPQIRGFYRGDDQRIGHILKDFIDGHPIDSHNPAHIAAIRRAFEHPASFQRDSPGPLDSGELVGIFWEDARPLDQTLRGLENFTNNRQSKRISLNNVRCALCHLDTALENML
jgi:hypothetical protein